MTDRPDDDETLELANRLLKTAVKLAQGLRLPDEPHRLTGAQISVLSAIADAKSITPSQLAANARKHRAAIASTLTQLRQLGLISRTPNPESARSVMVSATPAGMAIFTQDRVLRTGPLAKRLKKLEPAEVRFLAMSLPILEHLTAKEE